MYNWSFLFVVLHKPTLLPSTFKSKCFCSLFKLSMSSEVNVSRNTCIRSRLATHVAHCFTIVHKLVETRSMQIIFECLMKLRVASCLSFSNNIFLSFIQIKCQRKDIVLSRNLILFFFCDLDQNLYFCLCKSEIIWPVGVYRTLILQ